MSLPKLTSLLLRLCVGSFPLILLLNSCAALATFYVLLTQKNEGRKFVWYVYGRSNLVLFIQTPTYYKTIHTYIYIHLQVLLTQDQVGFCVSSYFFLFLPVILSWNVLWVVSWIFCFVAQDHFMHFYLVHWMGTLENFRKCYWTALLPWQPFTTTTGKHRKMKEESLFDMCMAGVTWFYPYKLHT